MGAKQSEEMREARRLVEGGMSAYKAAKQAGISRSAISQAQWYKDFQEKKHAASNT